MIRLNFTRLMIFCALFLGFSAQSQIIFSENFDGVLNPTTNLPLGFSESGLSTDGIWGTSTAAAASSQYVVFPATNTTKFAYTNDDACNCDKSDDRMILPRLSFVGHTGVSLNFSFFSQQYYGSDWAVRVSTDSVTWTTVFTDGANSAGWETKSINLSTYAGRDSVWIAFTYNDANDWAGGLGIDNISVEPTPNHDLAIGLTKEDANGWSLDYVRIPGFTYMPMSQMAKSELMFGATATNRGLFAASNAYLRLNIAKETVPGSGLYLQVYTDTLRYGTIMSDSTAWAVKDIADSTWLEAARFRYTYIVYQDSVDERPMSDTIVGYFNITNNMWSKVAMAADGGPFGDNAYLPSVTTGQFLSLLEWGSLYYFPKGANMKLDSVVTRVYSSTSANATQAIYQLRVNKIVDDGDNILQIQNDKQLVGLAIDTVPVTAGQGKKRKVTNIIDILSFNEFEFENDEIYYISVFQQNVTNPGLSDGTVRNGLYPYGQTFNHDAYVYGNGNNYVFYNPLITQNTDIAAGTTTDNFYNYGWSGGPEPSIFLYLGSTVVAVNEVEMTSSSTVELFPNPASNQITVNVSFENATNVKYIMTDATGRVVNLQFANNISTESRTFEVANMPAGAYFLTVKAENGEVITKRFIKR